MSPLEVAIVVVGAGGLLLSVRHWWGWLIALFSEVLWFAYGWSLHAHALVLMSVIWAGVNALNARRSWTASRVPGTSPERRVPRPSPLKRDGTHPEARPGVPGTPSQPPIEFGGAPLTRFEWDQLTERDWYPK